MEELGGVESSCEEEGMHIQPGTYLALQRGLLGRKVPYFILGLLHAALQTLDLLGSPFEFAHVLFNFFELLDEL